MTSSYCRAWDDGVSWHLDLATAPDLSTDPLSLETVRTDHLRSPNTDGSDDTYISKLMVTSLRMAERKTWRSILPTDWVLVCDRFPRYEFVLPRPPLLSVDRIDYLDLDGALQSLAGSPAAFNSDAPRGPKAPKGTVWPLYGTTWPIARCQPNAVRVYFTAGYPVIGDVADVPEDITEGRLLVIGEFYKQRSESVHAFNQNPALIRAADIWETYRAY